jgi:hypothetical protein
MQKKLNLSAPFDVKDCGHGLWRLRTQRAPATDVYVSGALPGPSLVGCTSVTISWPASGGAVLEFATAAHSTALAANNVFLHEPQPQLYADLPLAAFDARSQRFWWRVFALVRLPGGRFLLGWLASRARPAP